jgi:hypothetical protein
VFGKLMRLIPALAAAVLIALVMSVPARALRIGRQSAAVESARTGPVPVNLVGPSYPGVASAAKVRREVVVRVEQSVGPRTADAEQPTRPRSPGRSRILVVAEPLPAIIDFSTRSARPAKCAYLWRCGVEWGGHE